MSAELHPMINVYNTACTGDIGRAWYEYTSFLRQDGISPRAKLLDVEIGKRELNSCAGAFRKNLKKEGKTATLECFNYNYDRIKVQIFSKGRYGNPCVKKAFKDLEKAFKESCQNSKTKHFSRFIILKKRYPVLSNFRFLARFI